MKVNTQALEVFLCSSPANLPFSIAIHPWFVINDHGKLSRYEVLFRQITSHPHRYGHVYKDAFAPWSGIEVFPYVHYWHWSSRVLAHWTGDIAERLSVVIQQTSKQYPYHDRYFLTGPNSNTYTQWCCDQAGVAYSLPGNAIGARWGNI